MLERLAASVLSIVWLSCFQSFLIGTKGLEQLAVYKCISEVAKIVVDL